jgi:hypothetical protein
MRCTSDWRTCSATSTHQLGKLPQCTLLLPLLPPCCQGPAVALQSIEQAGSIICGKGLGRMLRPDSNRKIASSDPTCCKPTV